MSPEEFFQLKREYMAVKKARNENAGLRAEFTTKISLADFYRGQTFYLPHNLDFRGRAYVVPPHLSHLGDDSSRALLTFAERKPLGSRGFFWLKVHLANLFGVDKVSFEDRVKFVDDNLDRVHATARDPMAEENQQWWQSSDSPWQAVATCLELVDALNSPDPETFMSSLPVHQDGTCNGLQHYAALGRDVEGAKAVNLCPIPGLCVRARVRACVKVIASQTYTTHAYVNGSCLSKRASDEQATRVSLMSGRLCVCVFCLRKRALARAKKKKKHKEHKLRRFFAYLSMSGCCFTYLCEITDCWIFLFWCVCVCVCVCVWGGQWALQIQQMMINLKMFICRLLIESM